jgi:hypothetical protein
VKEAKVPPPPSTAQLLADGKTALARGDVTAARKAAQDMAALRDDLRAEFTLRIVNRPVRQAVSGANR